MSHTEIACRLEIIGNARHARKQAAEQERAATQQLEGWLAKAGYYDQTVIVGDWMIEMTEEAITSITRVTVLCPGKPMPVG